MNIGMHVLGLGVPFLLVTAGLGRARARSGRSAVTPLCIGELDDEKVAAGLRRIVAE